MERFDCERSLRYLSAFEDDELDPVISRSIQDHLDVCPSCRAQHAWEQETRRALERLRQAEPPASKALRSRIRHARTRDRRPVLGSIAALVAISVALFLAYLPRDPSSVVKTAPMEFALNHFSTLQKSEAVAMASDQAEAVEEWLSEQLPFRPWIPRRAPEGFQLRGARLCHVAGNAVGYLVYDALAGTSSSQLSVVIGPGGRCGDRGLREWWRRDELALRSGECGGASIATWESGSLAYVVAGSVDPGALREFAEQTRLLQNL